ncbi:hypothetical protein AB6A40_002289 [Gnathostoma spinigerum]|uniref:Uncharacterized protein n=1 Tax=Gnathostoma spinigerum TaxID=75299 RepID=A0ABD6E7B1_9BILA
MESHKEGDQQSSTLDNFALIARYIYKHPTCTNRMKCLRTNEVVKLYVVQASWNVQCPAVLNEYSTEKESIVKLRN